MLRNATIKDVYGNAPADRFLLPNGENSLSHSSNLYVDARVPTFGERSFDLISGDITIGLLEAIYGNPDASDFEVIVNGNKITLDAASVSNTYAKLTIETSENSHLIVP